MTKHYFSPTAQKVLESRYLEKNSNGEVIETPEALLTRVAHTIASVEEQYGASTNEIQKLEDDFGEMISNFEFLSGMSLFNAGKKYPLMSACFVLPIEDSMDSIFYALRNAAILHKFGGGVGYDFSHLRPSGDIVESTGKKTTGPISFMKLFNYTGEVIVGAAAKRKPGNMGILRVDHPDILDFINCKINFSELNNFNISVAITDNFMQAVINDQEYSLINPRTKQITKKLKAKEVFALICENSHRSAEPGIIFIDQMNKFNPTPEIGQIEATNVCGEQPLLPYEACNLGSINLTKMLKINFTGQKSIDWEKLKDRVEKGVNFLDNTIDISYYPLEEIKKMNVGNRKIGLGVMGFADLLLELNIPYNSPSAIKLAEELMNFITQTAREKSIELGKKKGSFINFKKSIWEKRGFEYLRNVALTTIAPTGTISILANCSSGIEPIFSFVYIRKNILGDGNEKFIEINPIFEKILKDNWLYSKELMEQVAINGSVQNIASIPQNLKNFLISASDVSPEWHVKIQATFQKYTDSAVSKTVNMPEKSTIEDVKKTYLLAYELGCKGITIYRNKSRDKQVLNIGK